MFCKKNMVLRAPSAHSAFCNPFQASLAGVMGNVAGVMKKVNDNVSTEELAKIMQQFAVENEKMGMSEEMMDDALINAVGFFFCFSLFLFRFSFAFLLCSCRLHVLREWV